MRPSLTPATCTQAGHRYAQVHLMRCCHLQGWHLVVSSHEDDGDGTTVLFEATVGFGPFDDDFAPLDSALVLLREAVLAVLLAELPGSAPVTPTHRRAIQAVQLDLDGPL